MIADASKVDGYLEQRRKISLIVDLTSWPRKNVLARANALGMLIDPETDTPLRPPRDQDEPSSLRSAARSLMEQRKVITPAQPAPIPSLQGRGEVEILLGRAEGIGGTAARQAKAIRDRLEKLRQDIDAHAEREALRRRIASHEAEIAKLRDTLAGRRTPREEAHAARTVDRVERQRDRLQRLGVTGPTVREWANANGFHVVSKGWISREALDAFEAAHTDTEVTA